jgi:hypothetical protein
VHLGDLKGPEESRGNQRDHAGGIWETLKRRILEGDGRGEGNEKTFLVYFGKKFSRLDFI